MASTMSMDTSDLSISFTTDLKTSRCYSMSYLVCCTDTVHCSSGPVAMGITPRFSMAV